MPSTVDRRRGDVAPASAPSRLTTVYSLVARRPLTTWWLAMATVPALGVLDWASGPELAFSIFYLLPISVVAWTTSTRRMLPVAVTAALTWLVADLAAGADYANVAIPLWNTSTRLAVFVLVGRLITQLRRSAQLEQQLARTDPLTGVSTSRWFYEQAAQRLERADSVVTLVYLDLDDFKAINDRHGHSGGDTALNAVGAALRQATRDGQDVIGRLGGDEFALLLTLPTAEVAEVHVAGIVRRVAQLLAAHPLDIGFSAGAVVFRDPPASVDAAIEAADELMYEVKRTGKRSFRCTVR